MAPALDMLGTADASLATLKPPNPASIASVQTLIVSALVVCDTCSRVRLLRGVGAAL